MGTLFGLWGTLGVVALLANASVRLGARAAEAMGMDLSAGHWVFLAVWVVFNGYFEAYRAFHRGFCPRVGARVGWLVRHPVGWVGLVAPLFAMGLVYANKKRLIASWIVTTAVVGIIAAIRQLSQPWRGLVDAGVVLPLAYGAAACLFWGVRGLMGKPGAVDPDLPASR